MIGDIHLLHGKSVVSRLIQFGADSYWSHALLHAGDAWGRPFVIEAAFEGVRLFPLERYAGCEQLVLRPAEDVGGKAVECAFGHLGDHYDFASYPALLLGGLRRRYPWFRAWLPQPKNDLFYCFELVAASYREAGFPLTKAGGVLPCHFIEAVRNGQLTVVRGELRR